jgi:hypothetical protein
MAEKNIIKNFFSVSFNVDSHFISVMKMIQERKEKTANLAIHFLLQIFTIRVKLLVNQVMILFD